MSGPLTGRGKNMFAKRFTSPRREDSIENDHPYLFVLFLQGELLLLDLFQLITEIEFGGFLLELGKLVLVFRHFFQSWFHAEVTNKRYTIIYVFSIPVRNCIARFLRCEKGKYLQFTSEIVDLAVQVRDLHVSNISINIHCIRYCDNNLLMRIYNFLIIYKV